MFNPKIDKQISCILNINPRTVNNPAFFIARANICACLVHQNEIKLQQYRFRERKDVCTRVQKLQIWDPIMIRELKRESVTDEQQFGFMPGQEIIDVTFDLNQSTDGNRNKWVCKSIEQK